MMEELKLDSDLDRNLLTRVKEAVDIWKLYLEINAEEKFLFDQEDIILSLAKLYCGKESQCQFNRGTRMMFLTGENKTQKQF